MSKGVDTHGAPAADCPNDLSNGEQAEKGDAHRPFRQYHGKTRHSTRQDVPSSANADDTTDDAASDDARGTGAARGAGARAPDHAAQRHHG